MRRNTHGREFGLSELVTSQGENVRMEAVQRTQQRIKEGWWRRETWVFLFFQSTSYSYRFTQWTICFLLIDLYTFANVSELVNDASYNTTTPPSLIQLYCSVLLLALRCSFGFYLSKRTCFGNMQDVLGRRRKPECTVKYFFPLLKCWTISKK